MRPGRAEDVAGMVQREPCARDDLGLAVHRDRIEHFDRVVDIGVVVQGLGRTVLGPAVLIGVLGGLELEPRTVAQHDLREPGGMCAGQNRPAETLPDQTGKVTAVIEVGVCHDHGVDVRCIARQAPPVAPSEVGETLEEPTVEQDPGVVALDEELTASDGANPAEEDSSTGLDRAVAAAPAEAVSSMAAPSLLHGGWPPLSHSERLVRMGRQVPAQGRPAPHRNDVRNVPNMTAPGPASRTPHGQPWRALTRATRIPRLPVA